MRKSRFTETQIVSILKEHHAGATFVDLGRRHGVHPNTVAVWKSKYGGMESSKVARARAIEDESPRMRRIIANLARERCDERTDRKKLVGPSQRKAAVRAVQELGLSERAACRLARCPRSIPQYKIRRVNDPRLIERLKTIAAERRRFGYRGLTITLRREGFVVNHKRVHRIYRAHGLQLQPRRERGLQYITLVGYRASSASDAMVATLAHAREAGLQLLILNDFA